MDEKALREFLAMLGADPRALALVNQLTNRGMQDPMAVNEAVGGKPGFFQGFSGGGRYVRPQAIQQSHPFMGALAGILANRRNAAERGRIEQVIKAMGAGGGGAATTTTGPMPGGVGPPSSPNAAMSDVLDQLYRSRTSGGQGNGSR